MSNTNVHVSRVTMFRRSQHQHPHVRGGPRLHCHRAQPAGLHQAAVWLGARGGGRNLQSRRQHVKLLRNAARQTSSVPRAQEQGAVRDQAPGGLHLGGEPLLHREGGQPPRPRGGECGQGED